MAWWQQNVALAVVSAICGLSLFRKWRWATAVRRIVPRIPPDADESTQLQAIFHRLTESPFNRYPAPVWHDLVQYLLRYLHTPSTHWAAVVIGAMVYISALVGPIYATPVQLMQQMGLDRLSRLIHSATARAAAAPVPILPLQCPVPATSPTPNTWSDTKAVVLTATFDRREQAEYAIQQLQTIVPPPIHVMPFGMSLFIAIDHQSGVDKQRYQAVLRQTGGYNLLVIQPGGIHIVAYVICRAKNQQLAERLIRETESYGNLADMFFLRAPWAPDASISESEQRARDTYELLERVEPDETEPDFKQLTEAFTTAVKQGDSDAEQQMITAIVRYLTTLALEEMPAATAESKAASHIDHDLLSDYVQLLVARLRDDAQPESIDSAEWYRVSRYWRGRMAQRMGQMTLESGIPIGPQTHVEAEWGWSRANGLDMKFDYIMFYRPHLGLPAFATYLCNQGCTDIHYNTGYFDGTQPD